MLVVVTTPFLKEPVPLCHIYSFLILSCITQDLNPYCQMKKLFKTSDAQNIRSFAKFKKNELSLKGKKNIKGGDDGIVVEDLINT